jgi:hypothetical protein
MRHFLEETAKKIAERFPGDISELLIVVPTRRACMYMKHYIAQTAGKTFLAPELMPLEEFMYALSDTDLSDTTKLLFEMYEIYRDFDERNISFEDFTPLGMTLLNDFNAIDRSMSDAESLFSFLSDAESIERWNLSEAPSEKQHSLYTYLGFWKNVRKTYEIFRNRLLAKRKAYAGLAYRLAADFCEERAKELGFSHIIFAGLSQLGQAEEQVVSTLYKSGLASCYWDTDSFFVKTPMHEAGYFFRKFTENQKDGKAWLKKNDLQAQDYLGTGEKNIYIISTVNNVTQAKVAGQILKNHFEKQENKDFSNQINHFGIFLPDEALLIPVLHALPDKVGDIKTGDLVNITMGIPLRDTPLYTLIQAVIKAQERMRMNNDGLLSVYYKDVRKILQHPYLKDLPFRADNPLMRIKRENLILFPLADLFNYEENGDIYQKFFDSWDNDTEKALEALRGIVGFLGAYFAEKGTRYNLDNEYLFEFLTLLQRIEKSMRETGEKISLPVFLQLLTETMQTRQVPFTGEPLKSVQIMGMLESRALDFENTVVLSCNEGILPKGKSTQSLLPFDARFRFGIPTHFEQDASFAYTFYRLLHRSKNVYLVYSAASDGIRTTEKSRFLRQIEQEFKDFENIKIHNLTAKINLPDAKNRPIKIRKKKKIIKKTLWYLTQAKKGFTTSTIETYLRNPFNFFLHKIFDISQDVTVEENAEGGIFGKILHTALENIFKDYIGVTLSQEQLLAMSENKDEIEYQIRLAMQTEANAVLREVGKNYINKEVAAELIAKYLKKSSEKAPFTILGTETELRMNFPFRFAGQTHNINLWGKIDKIILTKDNKFEIIDYKTGRIDERKVRISKSSHEKHTSPNEEFYYDPDRIKLMQLMIYMYLLLNNPQTFSDLLPSIEPNFENVTSGYWSFQNLAAGFIEFNNHNFGDGKSFNAFMEDFLKNVLRNMLDPNVPIEEKPNILKSLRNSGKVA